MFTRNKKTQKLISALLIISILAPTVLFSNPQKAEAVWGLFDTSSDFWVGINSFLTRIEGKTTAVATKSTALSAGAQVALKLKDVAKEIGKQVLMAVARRLMAEMTRSTVNWINSGFHGQPLFLENPESFFKDVTKTQLKDMVNIFGFDSLKYPFGRDFALNAIQSYKSTLANNASYSLSTVMNATQAANYRNDFNVGGWNGFLVNTQYPQNNYLGFQMIANQQLAINLQGTVQAPAQKIQKLLDEGQGFLSPQTCPSNPDYNNGTNEFKKPSFDEAQYRKDNPYKPPECILENPESGYEICSNQVAMNNYKVIWQEGYDIAKSNWGDKNTCLDKDGKSALVNTTPGSVAGAQITKALGVSQDGVLQAMGLGNNISAILDALLNHFIDKGLNSLASKINPPPPVDNWSYEGQTLDSSGSGNSWDSGPDEEIILSKFKEQISGKTIGTCSNIKDSSGFSLEDQTDISKEECLGQSIVTIDVGTCSDITDSTGKISLETQNNITKITCDKLKGSWKKTNTLTGNTPTWTPLGTCSSLASSSGNLLPDILNIPQTKCDIQNGTWKKNKVAGDIDNTQEEINLMDYVDTESPENVGIIQILKEIPIQIRTLDLCIPGPDKGWEDRLISEQDRINSKLSSTLTDNNASRQQAVDGIIKELKYAVDNFKNWINDEMIYNPKITGAIAYLDSIKEIDDFTQKLKEVSDARRAKSQALVRLKNILENLKGITSQPALNTFDSIKLIKLKKEYDALKDSISSSFSIEDTRNQLNTLKDQLNKLISTDPKNLGLIAQCTKERNKEWNDPDTTGKGKSMQKSSNVTEIQKFCETPISSGFSHGDMPFTYDGANGNGQANGQLFVFRNLRNEQGDPGYLDLPVVNAPYIYGEISCTGTCSHTLSAGGIEFNFLKADPDDNRVSSDMNCDYIFKSNIIDYTHAGDASF